MTHDTDTTHFGFRTVHRAEKAGMVRRVFDSVAPRYDLMNDLMSGGIHRLWKDAFVDWLDPRPGRQYLDVAGGTGDIAFRILSRANRIAQTRGGGGPGAGSATAGGTAAKGAGKAAAHVVVADINGEMLTVGRNRAIDRGMLHGLSWVVGDAEHLPLPDRSVDVYTIAFGLRNVTDIDQAIRDAHRLLRPGGRMMILEFSQVVVPVFDRLYDIYSFKVLPMMGRYVAQDEEAYRYLAESIRRFPPQEELVARMQEAGFSQVQYRNLSGGIAAMHSGWRL